MIDDDFESVFRKMMEQFMEAFGGMPEGNFSIRSWNGSIVDGPLDTQIAPKNDEPLVEKIDLGDSVLFLIQGSFESEPKVKVDGTNLTIETGSGTQNVELDAGFPVDLEKSNVSHRNGVIEITAIKAENPEENRGFLKIE
ncbi:MAG: hypothetical protein ACFFE6_00595 [Candidatus Thorarchaeota archaeon]